MIPALVMYRTTASAPRNRQQSRAARSGWWWKVLLVSVSLLLVDAGGAWSQQDLPGVDPQVRQAVERATQFLLSHQQENGAIHDRGHDTTMTSLSLMALASVGHQPADRTPRGDAMHRGLEFVLNGKQQDNRGYFGRADNSRMYGHGITTLMLTEMLGMGREASQDRRMHDALERAIGLILTAQAVPKPSRFAGGWRYEPDSTDADLSVSVWQLMALRSAKNDGLDVPSAAIDQAVAYLRGSATEPRGEDAEAGFSYTPSRNSPSFAMTAAGTLAMQVCGRYDAIEVERASRWLLNRAPNYDDRFFFYGCYYYAQGLHQQGGTAAAEAAANVREVLLEHQQADGSWQPTDGQEKQAGRVYATCLAILSLSVRYHYLPIYQR
jgi:hypothetical protein